MTLFRSSDGNEKLAPLTTPPSSRLRCFRLMINRFFLAVFLFLCTACELSPDSYIFRQMLNGLPAAAYNSSADLLPEHDYRHVLLLNSYNPGYDWTDEVTAGVQSVLNLTDSDVDLHTEYMDTKSVDDPDYFEYLVQLYQKKFSATRFDLVMAIDDDAFRFITRYRDQLFPGIPVVFCGVSDFDESMLQGQQNITGVLETHEHLKTIEMALRLHPNAKKLVIITDSTTTGKIHHRHLEELVSQLQQPPEILFLSDLEMRQIEAELAALPQDVVIYMAGFNRDHAGMVFSSEEALYRVTRVTDAPIYSYKYAYLGKGIVGGYITWGYPHGEYAAGVVKKILNGAPADSLPIMPGPVDLPLFDYRQLERFRISKDALPPDSIIAYGADPVTSRNNTIIFGLLVFMAGEMILIIVLIWNHRMRRKAEIDLRQSELRYRRLVENFPDGLVMLFDLDLRLRMAGGSSVTEFGLANEDLDGRALSELFPQETCDAFEPHFRLALQGTASLFEFTQHVHTYEVRTIPFCDYQDHITAGMAVIQNITRRKQSELELQVLTHELEQNEERLNLAIMGGDLGLWDWDIQSGGMVYNRRWAEMLGYALEEIEPHIGFWEQIVHPDDMPRIMHAFAEHFVGKSASYDNEVRMRTKSGEWKWILARGKVVRRDENGIPLRATGTHMDITERKQVEEALRKSMQNLDLAIMGANLGLWDWNLETDEMAFSNSWVKMMGYAQDEIGAEQRAWLQLVHPDDQAMLLAGAEAHIQGQVPLLEAEYRMCRHDGEWKWFLSRGRVVEFSADGTPLRMSGTLLDVTSRRLAQEEQQQVEERLEMALNAANLGLWDIDLRSQRHVCDQRFVDMLGFSLEDIDLMNADWWKSKVHVDDLAMLEQSLKEVFERKSKVIETEERVRTASGEWKWLQTRGNVVEWDEAGNPVRLVGTNLDINQKKRSEEALRSRMLALTEPYGDVSCFKFSDVFDLGEIQAIQDAFSKATGVASVINDLDGNAITHSSASTHLCRLIEAKAEGYENCRQSGRLLADSHDRDSGVARCIGAGLLTNSTPIFLGDDCIARWIIGEVLPEDIDKEALLAYGACLGIERSEFEAALNEMPCMSVEQFANISEAVSLIASQLSRLALQNILQAREITRRNRSEAVVRRSENRIRQLNEQLERRVTERTAELQAANRELETFSHTISHDLRAPLYRIDDTIRLLEDTYGAALGEDTRSYLAGMLENTHQMGLLIDDLLVFSQLNSQALKRQPLDLAEMAGRIFEELRIGFPDRKLIFNIASLPQCSADADMMEVMLSNVLSNAIKFTAPREEGRIDMNCEIRDGLAVFCIRDNGIGFDMVDSDKLFGVFQRLHEGNDFSGSGVGLAIARRIIQRHGGSIWAHSVVGQGAAFYFTLPASEPASDEGLP